MSRWYRMGITVRDFEEDKYGAISAAVTGAWDIEDTYKGEVDGLRFIEFVGEDRLAGGETEEEFAARVRDAVWKAAGRCRVAVIATCLEDLPFEQYVFSKEEFDTWKEKN